MEGSDSSQNQSATNTFDNPLTKKRLNDGKWVQISITSHDIHWHLSSIQLAFAPPHQISDSSGTPSNDGGFVGHKISSPQHWRNSTIPDEWKQQTVPPQGRTMLERKCWMWNCPTELARLQAPSQRCQCQKQLKQHWLWAEKMENNNCTWSLDTWNNNISNSNNNTTEAGWLRIERGSNTCMIERPDRGLSNFLTTATKCHKESWKKKQKWNIGSYHIDLITWGILIDYLNGLSFPWPSQLALTRGAPSARHRAKARPLTIVGQPLAERLSTLLSLCRWQLSSWASLAFPACAPTKNKMKKTLLDQYWAKQH